MPKLNNPIRDLLLYEREFFSQGHLFIAGVDEAGRGCLAGSVFAGAVIFPQNLILPRVDDSKKLSSHVREELFDEICKHALSWAVASVDSQKIDLINIHHASLLAMKLAVGKLKIKPQFLLIDGKFPIKHTCQQRAIISGDSLSHSIAAASILAKVSRDRWISEQGKKYKDFNFSKHKGYGTEEHRNEIEKFGLTPIHRRSFKLTPQ